VRRRPGRLESRPQQGDCLRRAARGSAAGRYRDDRVQRRRPVGTGRIRSPATRPPCRGSPPIEAWSRMARSSAAGAPECDGSSECHSARDRSSGRMAERKR